MTREEFDKMVQFKTSKEGDNYTVKITATVAATAQVTTYGEYLARSSEYIKQELRERLWRLFYEDRRKLFADTLMELHYNFDPFKQRDLVNKLMSLAKDL